MNCASCGAHMSRRRGPAGSFWMCDRCAARMGTMAFLHQSLEREPLSRLWVDARTGRGQPGRDCPSCRHAMQEVPLLLGPDQGPGGEAALIDLDVCPRCHVVFFDPEELEQMPLQPVRLAPRGPQPPPRMASPRPVPRALPPEENPLLQAKLDQIARDARVSHMPSGWKFLLAMFAPVEVDAPRVRRVPIVTWLAAAAIVLTAFFTFGDLGRAVQDWGFVPADPFRRGGLTLLTSFLLHGGVLHLLGNLYFLLIFGDNVEEFLGARRYLAVLAGATLAGILLHTVADPSSTVPLVGASGGISGVMILYAARFPHARLGLVIWLQWFTLPAVVYMAFWVGMQILGTMASAGMGGGGVAYLAHLGGAMVGALAWWFWGRTA